MLVTQGFSKERISSLLHPLLSLTTIAAAPNYQVSTSSLPPKTTISTTITITVNQHSQPSSQLATIYNQHTIHHAQTHHLNHKYHYPKSPVTRLCQQPLYTIISTTTTTMLLAYIANHRYQSLPHHPQLYRLPLPTTNSNRYYQPSLPLPTTQNHHNHPTNPPPFSIINNHCHLPP